MRSDAQRILDQAKYWELRRGSGEQQTALVSNGDVKDVGSTSTKGMSVRVLVNGALGFAYSEKEDELTLARRAMKMARSLKGKISIDESGIHKLKGRTKVKMNPLDIDLDQLVKMLRRKHNSFSKDKLIRNTGFEYQSIQKSVEFENSSGIDASQRLIYSTVACTIGAKTGSKTEQYDARVGRQGGFEIVKNGFSAMVDDAALKAKLMLQARVPKGGVFPVVCDHVLVDVLVHEAFGHASEADGVLKKESCLIGRVGQKLAGSEVSISDDPSIEGSWGSYFFDDEGVKARKTDILKAGILVGFMHSRETAFALGAEPTGHARSDSISSTPIVRMSNTVLESGSASDEELFGEVKNGFYLCGSAGGQVDVAKGNFQFNAKYGYRIKNGKLGEPVKGISVVGNTLKMLEDIGLVGKKSSYGMPGFCGKFGQLVPVVGINPKIQLKRAGVGGR